MLPRGMRRIGRRLRRENAASARCGSNAAAAASVDADAARMRACFWATQASSRHPSEEETSAMDGGDIDLAEVTRRTLLHASIPLHKHAIVDDRRGAYASCRM